MQKEALELSLDLVAELRSPASDPLSKMAQVRAILNQIEFELGEEKPPTPRKSTKLTIEIFLGDGADAEYVGSLSYQLQVLVEKMRNVEQVQTFAEEVD